MPQPTCTICDSEYALLIVTDWSDGETTNVGAACLPGYALSMAAGTTGGMTPEQAETYGILFDQVAANDTRPARKQPKRAVARSSGNPTSTPADTAGTAEHGMSGPEPPPEPHTNDSTATPTQTEDHALSHPVVTGNAPPE